MAGPTPAWPAFKGTLELRTRTLQNQLALVFSIPVCPHRAKRGRASPVFLCGLGDLCVSSIFERALRKGRAIFA